MADEKRLIETALAYRKRAYIPYSGFAVGAAIETGDGEIFGGCNIENAAYGVCNCAERTALYKAVSEGHRKFSAIAVVGGSMECKSADGDVLPEECPPCGICRQALAEFCGPELSVILARSLDDYHIYTLGELLPNSFSLERKP